jgi:predicted transcriptional regulator
MRSTTAARRAETFLRYDNAHGTHERHMGDAVEPIDFPGAAALYRRFRREVDAMDPHTEAFIMTATTDRPDVDTLIIRVEDSDAFDERVLDALDAIEDDQRDLEPALSVSLPDTNALSRVLSPANLELIRAIAADEPESIRETAALVDRDVKDVHRNLTELAELGMIELVQDGQAKRPSVWYDEIEVHLPVGGGLTAAASSDGAAV